MRVLQFHTDIREFYPVYKVWERRLGGRPVPFSAVEVPAPLPVPGRDRADRGLGLCAVTGACSHSREAIGILETAAPDPERLALWDMFKRRLHELGHAEGTDIDFEFRWAEGHTERLAAAAAELVGLKVDVLVTAGTPAAAAASRATSAIPIVMATGVGLGTQLTDGSRAAQRQRHRHQRPAAGRQRQAAAIAPRGCCPDAAALAILADRGNPSSPLALRETQAAAQALGITVKDYWIETAGRVRRGACGDAERRHRRLRRRAGRVVLRRSARRSRHSRIEHRLASITARREYAEAGCLMAYGAPIRDNYRQAADYVSRNSARRQARRACRSAEPAEFDFVINLKTAAALGLALPQALLARAEKI